MSRTTVLLLFGMMCIGCSKSLESINSMSEDEKAIRETRELSNQMIANHDSLHIGDFWMENFLLLTSTDVTVQGREDNVRLFSAHFKARPDVIYIRTPEQIKIFRNWNMASEFGHWGGNWSDVNGKVEISGTYYAKWHQINNKWLIRSEVFTPTHCKGGSYCDGLKIL